jgi:SET domain-containing protein
VSDAVPPALFEIRSSGIQGEGAFAIRPIAAGTTLIEYAGERISADEADRRFEEERARGRHHTFMFILDDDTVIDASRGGNEARVFNHSCDPNCETYEDDGRIWIAAMRAIKAGDELTYDYEYDLDDEEIPHAAELYPCRCGAATCRGTMYKPAEVEA